MKLVILFAAAVTVFGQQNLSTPVSVLNTTSIGGEIRWRDTTGHYIALHVPSTVSGNISWTLPPNDSGGVFFSDGAHDIQNDVNFTWNNSSQLLTATGISGTATILVPASSGFIQSGGGFFSDANVYNAFFSNTDGAVLRAYGIAPVPITQQGGYEDYAQILYPPTGSSPCYDAYGNLATQPVGLTGATFGTYPAYNSGTTYAEYTLVSDCGSIGYYSLTSGNVGHTPSSSPTFWAPIGGGATAGILSDVIIWNGPSPLQGYVGGSPYHINGTPCATPPITSSLNGLNVSSYVFARLGFATDVSASNAIQVFTGGMQAESYFVGGLYYAGTVTNCCGTISSDTHLGGYLALDATAGVPGNGSGCTSIGSCNNPLIPGEGVGEGMLYEESSTHHLSIYDSANWRELAYFGDSAVFTSVTASPCTSGGSTAFQTFDGTHTDFIVDCQGDISVGGSGSIIAINGSTGGLNVTANHAYNSIQTTGGFLSGGGAWVGTNATSIAYLCGGCYYNGSNFISTNGSGSGTATLANLNTGGMYIQANTGLTAGASFSPTIIDSFLTTGATLNALTIGNVTGSTQCLQANSSGVVTGSGGTCGGASYWTQSGTNLYYTTGNVGIGTSSPGTALEVDGGPISSSQTGANISFETTNADFQVDGQGNISLGGSGGSPYNGVIAINSTTGGLNVTANASLFSIQTVGGFRSFATGGDCSILFNSSVSSTQGCVTADILWALGQNGSGGVLRLSDASGSGGLDGAGAQILATSSTGLVQTQNNSGGFQAFNAAQTTLAEMTPTGITIDVSGTNTFTISAATGSISQYQKLPTAGPGIGWIAYSSSRTAVAGNAGISSVSMGVFPAGLYQLNVYISIVSAPTGCSGANPGPTNFVAAAWQDFPTGQLIWPLPVYPAGGVFPTFYFTSAPDGFQFIPATLYLNGSYNPTWEVLFQSGTTCGYYGTYNIYVSLEQIG